MRFPFLILPRSAWEMLASERDRLLTLVERAADHERRLERKAQGMPEAAPQPKPPFNWGAYPEVYAACMAWRDPMPQLAMAEQELRNNTPVGSVLAMLDARGEGEE